MRAMKFTAERENETINGNWFYTPQNTTVKRSSWVVQDLPIRDLNKRLQKPTLGCLLRERFNFFKTVSSIHLNLQFQLRSVREVG